MLEALLKKMFKQRRFVQNVQKQGGWQIKKTIKSHLMGKKVAGVCYLQSR